MPRTIDVIAINIGNTRTSIGRFLGGELDDVRRLGSDEVVAMVEQCVQWASGSEPGKNETIIVLASVTDSVAARLRSTLEDQLRVQIYSIGEDVPIPIAVNLDPETITGSDRLLNAAAAFESVRQACIIVDAGTAVTVDFVDGEGTFHGGAIAPGAQMQIHALHDHTEALPELDFTPPQPDEVFGKSTSQAMRQGVFHGIRGLVWKLAEQYAEHYGAFPMIIATGGDAQALFGNDELIDRVVPDLTLFGINSSVQTALKGDGEAEILS